MKQKKFYNVYLITRVGDMEKAKKIAQFYSKGVLWACLPTIKELYATMVLNGKAVIKWDND